MGQERRRPREVIAEQPQFGLAVPRPHGHSSMRGGSHSHRFVHSLSLRIIGSEAKALAEAELQSKLRRMVPVSLHDLHGLRFRMARRRDAGRHAEEQAVGPVHLSFAHAIVKKPG